MLDGSTCARQNPVISAGTDRWRCGGRLGRHAVSRVPVTSAPTIAHACNSSQRGSAFPRRAVLAILRCVTRPKTRLAVPVPQWGQRHNCVCDNRHLFSRSFSPSSVQPYDRARPAGRRGLQQHPSSKLRALTEVAELRAELRAAPPPALGNASILPCEIPQGLDPAPGEIDLDYTPLHFITLITLRYKLKSRPGLALGPLGAP